MIQSLSDRIVNTFTFTSVQIRAYHIPFHTHEPVLFKDIGWIRDKHELIDILHVVKDRNMQNNTVFLSTDNPGVFHELNSYKKHHVMVNNFSKHRYSYDSDVSAMVDVWTLSRGHDLLLTQHSTFGTLACIYSHYRNSKCYILKKHYVARMKYILCLHLMSEKIYAKMLSYKCVDTKHMNNVFKNEMEYNLC